MKTQDKILQSARHLFNESNIKTITTNHIAREAEISPGNLYYHYKNKEEIVLAIFEQFVDEECQRCSNIEMVKGVEGLRKYYAIIFEVYRKYRFIFRESFALASEDENFRLRYGEYKKQQVKDIETTIRALQKQNVVAAMDDPMEIKRIAELISLILNSWMTYYTNSTDSEWEAAADSTRNIILHIAQGMTP